MFVILTKEEIVSFVLTYMYTLTHIFIYLCKISEVLLLRIFMYKNFYFLSKQK